MKTFTISLSGKIFNIDDPAFVELKKYLDTLKAHYTQEMDGDEIMFDIESRIAELFLEYLQHDHREVIIITDVEKIIETMGSPDIIFDADQPQEPPLTSEKRQTTSVPKKLFRDAQDRVFGGVASGLAHYLDVPTLLVRICFLLMMLCYGVFFIIYMLMWILLPQAVTPKQKLQMEGKKINISDIEGAVRDSYKKMRDRSKNRFKRQGTLSGILKITAIFICGYIALVLFASMCNISLPIIYNNYFFSFVSPISHILGSTFDLMDILYRSLICIPIFLFAYLLLQFIRSKHKNSLGVIKITATIWLALLFTFILLIVLR